MDKILTLHRDKAYRAKIESIKVNENDFFYDTYRSAEKIVNDIIKDMQVLKKTECDSGFKYKARFAGLGNNIVFFSGGRGYGKTSVMRSFAKYLMEDGKGKKFIVLDSIDPSAMESGENILRVVMSRMYYTFEKMDKEFFSNAIEDTDIYRKNKFKLLENFQKCYDSIDSIKYILRILSRKRSQYFIMLFIFLRKNLRRKNLKNRLICCLEIG